jgi:hypothetical protein
MISPKGGEIFRLSSENWKGKQNPEKGQSQRRDAKFHKARKSGLFKGKFSSS